MIGKRLSHYEITAKIGEGGMGEVYRAKDLDLGRSVALKVLPTAIAEDPERLKRFKNEARIVAALKHPHIVTIHSVEEADDLHFLTLELVEGRGLDELIPEQGFDLDRFFEIAIPFMDALASAHEKGVVHRDLKPANVMIDEDAGLKVLDFGLAKLQGDGAGTLSQLPTLAVTQEGQVLGTIPYMSPEQADGKELDHRTDIFSAGAILYEMITGQRPFGGETALQLMTAIVRDEPTPIDELRDDLPTQLSRIITQCLAKDPKARFQSALTVRNELRALKGEISTGSAIYAEPERARGKGAWILGIGALILFALLVTWWPNRRSAPAPETEIANAVESVAVLPLVNLSGDPDQEYFADGMTEALINDLSGISALKVISRTSIMRYKETDKTLPEIAAELGVDSIIEGSVMRSGDRVRISAQLVDATSEENIWAESYEREISDLLSLQSEVARTVAREIEVSLTQEERNLLTDEKTVDPAAHEAYLKGRYFMNLLTLDGFDRGDEFMQQALAIDPTYAPAHVGLAQTYIFRTVWGYMPTGRGMPLAEAAAARALELDETNAEAHEAMAYARSRNWNWEGAEASYLRALELNPGLASAHHRYGQMLSMKGREREALPHAELACELDPLAVNICVNLGMVHQNADRFDDAEVALREVLAIHPQAPYAQWALAQNMVGQGRWEEAIEAFLARPVATAAQNFMLGHVYGLVGETEKAQEIADWLIERSRSRFVPPVQIAIVFIGMGENDLALEWIDRAFDREELWGLEMMKVQLYYDPIRDDPRFDDRLARTGLAD